MNSTSSADFYRAFEDRERGSRELILSRLQAYRPLLDALVQHCGNPAALDLGCGRGEWLQVLSEANFNGVGVDQDESMLQACEGLNLVVHQGDALEYLKQQPDSSQMLITAFHLAEHLPFEILQQLIEQSQRVLEPGGVLIMETPNPENLSVGAHTFYLDPTHERPLPPALLQFLPDYYGFERTAIWRLQETTDMRSNPAPSLNDVLHGVSPDYAVIAQKSDNALLTSALHTFFTDVPGVSLVQLAQRFDSVWQERSTQLTTVYKQLSGLLQVHEHAEHLQQQLVDLENRVQQSRQRLDAVYESRSWQITAPLRWFGFQARLLRQHGVKARLKAMLRKLLASVVLTADSLTRNSHKARQLLFSAARTLGLHQRLLQMYQTARFERAAAAAPGAGYTLTAAQQQTQAGWLPPERRLSLDELRTRIDKEIADSQGGHQ
jgi:O-antigen chain-terminating methyltransferase